MRKMLKDSSANFKETTIAAVSTGLTPAGIAVIRLSGPEALSVADRVFSGRKKLTSVRTHTVHYGKIVDPENDQEIDEVLATGSF